MASRSAASRWLRGTGALAALAVAAAASSSAFGRTSGYLIRPGDTISALASRFGVTQAALVKANHLDDPNRIYAGHSLTIPAAASTVAPGVPTPPPSASPSSPARGSAAAATAAEAASPEGAGALGSSTDVVTPGPLIPVTIPAPGAAVYPPELLAHAERLTLIPTFKRWASASGVPVGLLEAVAWMESGWRPTVVSATGAVGIGQIEPTTAVFISTKLLGSKTTLDTRVAKVNIQMSAAYLSWLLHQTNGDVATALGGYYQGLRTLRAKGPLNSTRRYVAGVGALWGLFRSG